MPSTQPHRLWFFETLDWDKAKKEMDDHKITYKAFKSPNLTCIKGYIQLAEPQRSSYFSTRCPSTTFYHNDIDKHGVEAYINKTHPEFFCDRSSYEIYKFVGSINYGSLHVCRGYDVKASGVGDLVVDGECCFGDVKMREESDIFIAGTSVRELLRRIEVLEASMQPDVLEDV